MNYSFQYIYFIFILLILVSLLVSLVAFYQKRKNRGINKYDDLVIRTRMWWGMAIIFFLSIAFHPNVSLLSLMILCFLALKEYFSMMDTRKQDRRIFIWAYLSIPLNFYWIYIGWYGMFIVFIPIYVFLFLPLARIFKGGSIGFLKSVSVTQWGVMLMVFGISHLALFAKMPEITRHDVDLAAQYGALMVLYLVSLTQANDVIHYLVSKKFGKKKVLPLANPNLTWEGFAVGVAGTIILSVLIAPYITPMSVGFSMVSGLIIGVAGFFGTVVISVLKRNFFFRERSESMPESKFINKIDSLTYTAPVFFHLVYYYIF
ncbi:phosphatidate cytidylyltransferase [Jeotgalibacillus proteolyticus]|uniref:CDP-diglyceride synthetase n=1 Tax=Jeotgalibacillus proteolyticus TaxID=2082395 RepID=A0A2S5G648_9BACL|nr:phosphatidate cytidylyltransferase [Jeotgalibacillus proteolyticus]PPA68462.1 CDP-diglyceride synthetase [Jeotgalibacillus proteolyticus]